MNRIIALFTINKIVMKKNTLTLVIATVVILFFFTGCDKYHRNRYTGTWDFVTERVYYNAIGSDVEKRETVYYKGKIIKSESENLENGLLIQYTAENEVYAWVEKNEDKIVYLYTLNGEFAGKYPSGKIDDNNLYLNLYRGLYVHNEGDYEHRIEHVAGIKISKK